MSNKDETEIECYLLDLHRLYHIINTACGCSNSGEGPYHDMVSSWGYKILLWKEIGSYQGDCLVFLQDNDRFGYTAIAYGSCSGCDLYYACSDWNAKRELCQDLKAQVVWYNRQEMIAWLSGRDWESKIENCIDEKATPEFVKEALDILKGEVNEKI